LSAILLAWLAKYQGKKQIHDKRMAIFAIDGNSLMVNSSHLTGKIKGRRY
jgi:hypothetical protein